MWLKLGLSLVIFLTCAKFATSSRISRKADGRKTDPVDGINYRLPNDTIPLRYDIWLSTDIDRGYYDFQGRVTIIFEVLENTSEITLHYRQLEIENVRLLRGTGGSLQSNVDFETVPEVEFLVIKPILTLMQGMTYQVQITYIGTHRIEKEGFYLSSYTNSFGVLRMMAATNFKSTDARHAFPW